LTTSQNFPFAPAGSEHDTATISNGMTRRRRMNDKLARAVSRSPAPSKSH
jgi:hypothetical protein